MILHQVHSALSGDPVLLLQGISFIYPFITTSHSVNVFTSFKSLTQKGENLISSASGSRKQLILTLPQEMIDEECEVSLDQDCYPKVQQSPSQSQISNKV